MTLLTESPPTISLFVNWLYTGGFEAEDLPVSPDDLVKLYALGEQWMIIQLREICYNRFTTEIEDNYNTLSGPPVGWFNSIYLCYMHWATAKDSKLRYLFAFHFMRVVEKSTIIRNDVTSLREQLPNTEDVEDFFLDTIIASARLRARIVYRCQPEVPRDLSDFEEIFKD